MTIFVPGGERYAGIICLGGFCILEFCPFDVVLKITLEEGEILIGQLGGIDIDVMLEIFTRKMLE